jgi:hypothetical protein
MDIPTAGGPIPAAAIPALARAAADFAARHGDPSPVSITAVASRRGEAVEYASRGNQIMDRREDSVYLVRMEGEFFLFDMPRPHSAPLPTGRFLFVVFDPRTLGKMDMSLSGSDHRPPMSTLGPVTNLMELSDCAACRSWRPANAPSAIRTCGLLLRRSSQPLRLPAPSLVGRHMTLSESDYGSLRFTA